MNKTKILMATLAHIALAVFFMVAIWPALNGSNDGYTTKTAPVVTTTAPEMVIESVVEPLPDVAVEPPVEPTPTPEVVVEAVVEEVVTEESPATSTSNTKENEAEGALYSVVDGNKLDANSYAGFKLFRNWCSRCHAKYGMGLDDGGLGANLLESIKILSKEEFFATVKNGKSGQIGSMPAWKANIKVMENRDQIYSYLKARSDGAIGNVKPKKQ